MYSLLEYSSKYSSTRGSLWIYSKDKAADFNANITDNDNFETFKFNTKLTESTYTNGIIQNVTIAVPRNYLSNLKQSLEIPLINYEDDLKLKCARHYVLALGSVDDADANPNNIILLSNTQNYITWLTFYQKKAIKNCQIFLADQDRLVYWNGCKTKSGNRDTKHKYRYFLKSNFLVVKRTFKLIYSNQVNDVKRYKALRYFLIKGIMIMTINGENFYDQPIDSQIKRYK